MKNEFRMYVGPMFGGKTTRMLSQAERYRYQDEDIYFFKPAVDKRYDQRCIVTHTGRKSEALLVSEGEAIIKSVIRYSGIKPCVVAVDEAFMIPGSGEALVWLFKTGHTILISSLQLSSDGSPYPEVAKMFPYATHVEVCPAVCPVTKRDAYYTEKIGGRSDHAIEVGGAEMYQPRCWQEFFGREHDEKL